MAVIWLINAINITPSSFFLVLLRVSVLEGQLPKHRMAEGREGSFPHQLAITDKAQPQDKDGSEWKNKSAHLKLDTESPGRIISVKTTSVVPKRSYAEQEQEQKRELLLHMTIPEVCKYNFYFN